jgi:hypothetical protein
MCSKSGLALPDLLRRYRAGKKVGDESVLDFVMIASTIGFFAACLAYMAGCERLQDGDQQQ